MPDPSLVEVAGELYTAPPAEFVSLRNARAKEVSDRDLAQQIRALRKPSIAAWVVNLFAAERADRLGQAMQLAEDLREAQEDLDAQTLSKLSRDRRALTAQLAREAASLASARGERVTDSTLEAVHGTITAAFFDSDAAIAIASGRLLRDLEPAGDSALDLDDVVAGGAPEPAAPRKRPTDDVRARREKKKAEQAVRAAEQAFEQAKRDQEKADAERRSAESRAQRLAAKVEELRAELEKTRTDAKSAQESVDDASRRAEEAAAKVIAAKETLEEARAALESR